MGKPNGESVSSLGEKEGYGKCGKTPGESGTAEVLEESLPGPRERDEDREKRLGVNKYRGSSDS